VSEPSTKICCITGNYQESEQQPLLNDLRRDDVLTLQLLPPTERFLNGDERAAERDATPVVSS